MEWSQRDLKCRGCPRLGNPPCSIIFPIQSVIVVYPAEKRKNRKNHNSFIKTWLKARVVVETGSSELSSWIRIAVHYYELRASSGTLLLMINHADPNDICRGETTKT